MTAPRREEPRATWQHVHITSLDGLRTIAVLLVMLAHTGRGWAYAGAFGVDVFFVLSGFLITSILLAEHASRRRLDLKRFYTRRALRLYPPLVLVLVLCFPFRAQLFDLPELQTAGHYAQAAGLSLTYVTNVAEIKDQMGAFGHFWSLAVEEQFYLLWPALLLGMLALSRGRWKVLASMISVLAIGLLAFDLWSTAPARGKAMYSYQTLLPTRAWELLVGCLIAVVLGSGVLTHLRERRWWSLVGGLGLVLVLAAVYRHRASGVLPDEFFRSIMRGGTVTATLGAVLLVLSLAMSTRGPLVTALSSRPMVWVGRISYGLYVFHYPVFHIVKGLTAQYQTTGYPVWINVLQFGLTFAVAGLSFLLWERPFLRLKGSRRPAVQRGRAAVTVAMPVARRPQDALTHRAAGGAPGTPERTVEMPRVVVVGAQRR